MPPRQEVIAVHAVHAVRTATLGLALLLAACGGGEDPAVDVREPEGPGATQESPTEPEAEPETGAGDDLTELAGAWAQTAARVSYDMVSASAPAQTMVLFWMPPDSWRMDLGGAGSETIIISAQDAGYVCTSAAGLSQCVESPTDVSTQSPIPFGGLFSSPEGIQDEIEAQTGGAELERSTANIAGLKASCFAMAGTSGDAQWCFSGDGILLRYAASGASTAGEFRMEATEVDLKVRASDFAPPYPVTEIGA